MSNPILDAVENINSAFEEFKTTNDERLEAEQKGNEARARELSEKLDRIERDIVSHEKAKKEEERKAAILQERVEILESINDRPGKTAEEKAKDEYAEWFWKGIRSKFQDDEATRGMRGAVQKMREYGSKSISLGTAGDGGHALPEEISRAIDSLMLKQSDILNEIKFIEVGSSDYKELLSINSTGAAWSAEGGARSEQTTPTLRQIAPTWGELYSYLFSSTWAIEDIFFDVESWLRDTTAEQFAKAVDLAVWSGDASAKPTGMTNATPVTTADYASPMRAAAALQYIPTDSASPQAMGFDDVYDLLYSLNRAYRPNAKFFCNTVTQGGLRKLKDSNGQYLWQVSNQAGQPSMLAGFPVVTWEDMADFTTADGFYLGFGDLRKGYTLCYRRQLAVTVDNNVTTPGTVKFYIRRRFGGIVANNDAIKLLKLADT
jgi:HK97 family phage major capsid protein